MHWLTSDATLKTALVIEAFVIFILTGKYLFMRRTRSRLANQLLKIVYEVGGRKGVVSHLTMKQTVQVMAETGSLREQAKART